MKKTKYLLIALVLALAGGGALLLGDETRALSTYKNIRELKAGDIIYYDNSGTNWDEVRVYLFSKNGGSERFDWNSRPTMSYDVTLDTRKFFTRPTFRLTTSVTYKSHAPTFSHYRL